MTPEQIAWSIIAAIVATAVMLCTPWRKFQTGSNLVIAVLATLFAGIGGGVYHMCNAGQPTRIHAIFLIITGVWMFFCRPWVARLAAFFLIGALSTYLQFRFNTIVHSRHLCGNPDIVEYTERQNEQALRRLLDDLTNCETEMTSSPLLPGPLAACGVTSIEDLAQDTQDSLQAEPHLTPFWHTSLTGLYAQTSNELTILSDGGTLTECVASLRLEPAIPSTR